MKIIIATIKSWNIMMAEELKEKLRPQHSVTIITEKEELSTSIVCRLSPDFIFFPHWSYIIPADIYDNYNCVVFHMTDLPYGRGGSPLQNLIVRGHKATMISALKVVANLDAGPIYFKEPLSLEGSADDIYRRASKIVFETMIPRFLESNYTPIMQTGEPVVFKRRKPEDGQLQPIMSAETIYDYIRMLDAEGYPNAYVEFGDWMMTFKNAVLDGEEVMASVKFSKKE